MTNDATSKTPGLAALWAGWWLAAVAWIIHLGASYTLVDWFCHNDTSLSPGTIIAVLHGLTLFTAALALAGAALAWRNRLLIVRTGPDGNGRKRFMSIGGLVFSLFLTVIILVEGIPNFILRPCL